VGKEKGNFAVVPRGKKGKNLPHACDSWLEKAPSRKKKGDSIAQRERKKIVKTEGRVLAPAISSTQKKRSSARGNSTLERC